MTIYTKTFSILIAYALIVLLFLSVSVTAVILAGSLYKWFAG